mmetsp:Transcript_31003/g.93764  ORF Transcript_31003/g.93764 Transcript_31003/m.93764 type:complete len:371 (+) Transcript_31003:1314-2426(+)
MRDRGGECVQEPRRRGILEQEMGLVLGARLPPVPRLHLGRQGGLVEDGVAPRIALAERTGYRVLGGCLGAPERRERDQRLRVAVERALRAPLRLRGDARQQGLVGVGAVRQRPRLGSPRRHETSRRERLRNRRAGDLRGDRHPGARRGTVGLQHLQVRGRGGARLHEPSGRGLPPQAMGEEGGPRRPAVPWRHLGRQAGLLELGLAGRRAAARLAGRRAAAGPGRHVRMQRLQRRGIFVDAAAVCRRQHHRCQRSVRLRAAGRLWLQGLRGRGLVFLEGQVRQRLGHRSAGGLRVPAEQRSGGLVAGCRMSWRSALAPTAWKPYYNLGADPPEARLGCCNLLANLRRSGARLTLFVAEQQLLGCSRRKAA